MVYSRIQFNKRTWICIILMEFILLLGTLLVLHNRPHVDLNFTQDDLIYDTGEAGFYLDNSYEAKYIYTPDFVLPKGFYTINMDYEYRGTLSRANVIYADERADCYVSGNIYFPVSSINFRIKYSNRPIRIRSRLSLEALDEDYILIRNIHIESSPLTSRNMLFRIIMFFLTADIVLLLVCNRDRILIGDECKSHLKMMILLIIVNCIPLMVDYLINGHDLLFHLTRIEGIKEELLNGNFPSRIQYFWLNGHGYPASVFYGDLLLYIPAVFRIFGVSIQSSYFLYVLLINIGTVLITHYCFSKMSNAKIGMICTIVYSLNIFRFMDIYTRSAVGEYTAIMFLPLVLYGMWIIYSLPEEQEEHAKGWIPLMIGCVGIFLSHMITTELTAFFIILTAIILYKKTFRRKTFLVLVKAAVSTLLLSLWFLVPFLDYMISGTYLINDPSVYVAYRQEERGIFLAQLFMNRYAVIGNNYAIATGIASEMPLTVGLASIIVLAGWIMFCLGKKRDPKEKKEEYLAVFLCIISMGMALHCIPYSWFADRFSALRLVVRSIQYPWRFLTIAGVLLVWLLCIILQKEWIDAKKKKLFVCVLLFIAFWQGITFMSEMLYEAPVYRAFQDGDQPTAVIGNGEYLPVAWKEGVSVKTLGDYTSAYINQLTYEEGSVSISDWYKDYGEVTMALTNHTDEIQQVEVPLLLYKGSHAFTDEGEQLQISPGASYRISVFVPAGYSGTIRVGFSEPWYWRVCEVISLFTLILLIFYPYLRKYNQKKSKMVGV